VSLQTLVSHIQISVYRTEANTTESATINVELIKPLGSCCLSTTPSRANRLAGNATRNTLDS
jgi:hypothetical protein